MLQCELNSRAMPYPHCFGSDFTLIYVVVVQCAICLKFLSSFRVSGLLNFKLSSTRLLMKWFLIEERLVLKVF